MRNEIIGEWNVCSNKIPLNYSWRCTHTLFIYENVIMNLPSLLKKLIIENYWSSSCLDKITFDCHFHFIGVAVTWKSFVQNFIMSENYKYRKIVDQRIPKEIFSCLQMANDYLCFTSSNYLKNSYWSSSLAALLLMIIDNHIRTGSFWISNLLSRIERNSKFLFVLLHRSWSEKSTTKWKEQRVREKCN